MEEHLDVQTEMEEAPRPKSRRFTVLIGAAALLVIIAAAAFVGGRFINGRTGSNSVVEAMAGPGGQRTYMIEKSNVTPAKELPVATADTHGLFVRRSDNSIFIGTGKVTFMVAKDPGGDVNVDSEYDGSEVEVVVTNETKVYVDTTDYAKNPGENEKVEQKVTEGSLDEIGQNSTVTVWGRKAGDRYIADVLVYSMPLVLNKAKPNN